MAGADIFPPLETRLSTITPTFGLSKVEIKLPDIIEDLKRQAQEIKEEKVKVINSQRYEEAANLRDKERKILSDLQKEKETFEKNRNLAV